MLVLTILKSLESLGYSAANHRSSSFSSSNSSSIRVFDVPVARILWRPGALELVGRMNGLS